MVWQCEDWSLKMVRTIGECFPPLHRALEQEGPCGLITQCQRHKNSTVSVVQAQSRAAERAKRPARRVHFATAELVPDFGKDSGEDDNLSGHHVSLLPSRSYDEEDHDRDKRPKRWWRDESFVTAMAIPIF